MLHDVHPGMYKLLARDPHAVPLTACEVLGGGAVISGSVKGRGSGSVTILATICSSVY